MHSIQLKKYGLKRFKFATILLLLASAIVLLTLLQDFLRSDIRHSAYYFSESLLFSSFWWLFVPGIYAQYRFVARIQQKKPLFLLALIIIPILSHLLLFPFQIWLISGLLYSHTYAYTQTFQYSLTEHLYLLVLFYTIPNLSWALFKRTEKINSQSSVNSESKSIQPLYISNLLVSDGHKKQLIETKEILYFSANPPYITIHLSNKKYLYQETLKSIALQLDSSQFVRVHKSAIVNISMVSSCTSRLNGDYDITLKNNTQVRVSRNFAAQFKKLWTSHTSC